MHFSQKADGVKKKDRKLPFVSEPHERRKVVPMLLNYKLSVKLAKPVAFQEVRVKPKRDAEFKMEVYHKIH